MLIASRYQARMAEPGRDEDILARLKIACWRESYGELLPADILEGLNLERSRATWRHSLKHGIAWIAEQGGVPVGFGHMHDDEVTTLYVLASDQGHGLGCIGDHEVVYRQRVLAVVESGHLLAVRGYVGIEETAVGA